MLRKIYEYLLKYDVYNYKKSINYDNVEQYKAVTAKYLSLYATLQDSEKYVDSDAICFMSKRYYKSLQKHFDKIDYYNKRKQKEICGKNFFEFILSALLFVLLFPIALIVDVLILPLFLLSKVRKLLSKIRKLLSKIRKLLSKIRKLLSKVRKLVFHKKPKEE